MVCTMSFYQNALNIHLRMLIITNPEAVTINASRLPTGFGSRKTGISHVLHVKVHGSSFRLSKSDQKPSALWKLIEKM